MDRREGVHRGSGRRGRSWGTAAEARHYFGLRPDASTDELLAIVDRYPVFRVVERGESQAPSRPAPHEAAPDPAAGPMTEQGPSRYGP
jgi:hypothetical protein